MGQLGPAPKRQRTSRHNKEPIVIRNMGETWPATPPLGPTRGLEQAGVPVNMGDPTLGEHDILAQPNTYTSPDLLTSFQNGSHSSSFVDSQTSSLGLKRKQYDVTSPSLVLNPGLSSFHSNPSPVSVSDPSYTSLSLNPQRVLNPVSTDLVSSANAPTSSTYYPNQTLSISTAMSDLPGDLSSISPLHLGSDVPLSVEGIQEYLNPVSSQGSHTHSHTPSDLQPPTLPRRDSTQMVSSYLQELSHTGTPSQPVSHTGTPSQPPPHTGTSLQPLYEADRRSNTDSPEALHIAGDLTDFDPLATSSKQSADVHYSDSSSGVSSAGAKFSPESPLLSPSLALHSPSYIEDLSDEFDDLLNPIPEPFPSLADDGEYMNHDPDLVPPDPPPTADEEEDLNPEVPVFEVCPPAVKWRLSMSVDPAGVCLPSSSMSLMWSLL